MNSLFKQPSIDKLEGMLKSNHNQNAVNKILFKDRKSMKYTKECVENLKRDIRRLFERLNCLHEAIEKKRIPPKSKNEIISRICNLIIESCSNKKLLMSQSVLNKDSKKQSEIFLQFNSFFKDEKSQLYPKRRICFCPNGEGNQLSEEDEHMLPSFKFKCHRTGKVDTSFFITESSTTTGKKKADFIDAYLDRIANGCSIHHSPISPDSGDCGLHLLANIVCYSSPIVKNQNKLRKLMHLPLLFDVNRTNIKGLYKIEDCTLIVRELVSQFLKTDESSIDDLLKKETFEEDLIKIYEITEDNQITFLGPDEEKNKKKSNDEMEDEEVNIWTKKKTKKNPHNKRNNKKSYYYKLPNLPLDKIANTYSKIVARCLLKFCSFLEEDRIKTFREMFGIYTSLPPSLVGRLGCHWMNEDVIAWFEVFFCVKVFVCRPGLPGDYHFAPSLVDFDKDEPGNDYYFKIKNNQICPIGLVVIVFEGFHYQCVLRNSGSDCPFYQIGKELPDMFYNAFDLSKEYWEDKTILSKINKHNENVIKERMNLNQDTKEELPKFMTLQFNSPKLNNSLSELTKIVFPLGKPNEMNLKDTKGKKAYDEGIDESRYYTRFESSIYTCDFALKPSYLAGLIFQYVVNKNFEDFKKEKFIESQEAKKHLLIGKNIDDVDIIACFSFDARRVWQGSHRDFNEFVKEAKVDEKKSLIF